MRMALSDGRIAECYKMLYKLLKSTKDEELRKKISFLEWHKDNAEKEKNTTNYRIELDKTITELNNNGVYDYGVPKIIYQKFDKEDSFIIENRFVDIADLFTDFLKEWKGKLKTVYDGFVVLNDSSIEIYTEVIKKDKIIYFRCWGESNEIESFLTNVKHWLSRESKERGALKVFLSYSHVDEKWKDILITSLAILKHNKLIKIWHDRGIKAGADWSQEIEDALNQSQLVFLLISPEFIASEYCYLIETQKAIERHTSKLTRVIPIFVRPTLDKGASYLHLQGFPNDKKPLNSFGKAHTDNKGIQEVAKAISDIVYEIHRTGTII
jgi:hypothetical protein